MPKEPSHIELRIAADIAPGCLRERVEGVLPNRERMVRHRKFWRDLMLERADGIGALADRLFPLGLPGERTSRIIDRFIPPRFDLTELIQGHLTRNSLSRRRILSRGPDRSISHLATGIADTRCDLCGCCSGYEAWRTRSLAGKERNHIVIELNEGPGFGNGLALDKLGSFSILDHVE